MVRGFLRAASLWWGEHDALVVAISHSHDVCIRCEASIGQKKRGLRRTDGTKKKETKKTLPPPKLRLERTRLDAAAQSPTLTHTINDRATSYIIDP